MRSRPVPRQPAPSLGVRVRLALGDLRAEPVRTVLSVLVLAPLAASWFLLATIAGSLDTLGKVGEARNVVVTENDVFDLSNIALGDAELQLATAAAGADAESVTPAVLRLVKLDNRVLQLRAAEVPLWSTVHGLRLLAGRLPDEAADEMAITQAVQTATGWQLGDQQRVFGTSFTITGVLQGSGSKVASLWLPLARAEALFERPGEYQFAMVRVAAGADGDAVRARLRAALPGYLVLDESAIQAEATRGVRSLGELALLFTSLGIVGLAVGSGNATALALAERGRSVGLLRVMGFTPAAVRGLLAVRALLLAAASLAVGLAIAWPLIAARPSFVLRSFIIEPRLQPLTAVLGCVLSLASAWAGAMIATRRALRRPAASLLGA
ncbi:MAG: ABC transporter permease [Actinomycetota bacterium]|nr:ABC transporter permease [Actinomycetota bacterium]